ncbi:helix-turn-helix domain-containing protein, partial [Candidatus Saccharibacteria bacterium]|nr:helix-turn-helix domain-containing protein [Candidatus Saccharibacteria bacterium]
MLLRQLRLILLMKPAAAGSVRFIARTNIGLSAGWGGDINISCTGSVRRTAYHWRRQSGMTNKPTNKNETQEETINLADERLFWFCQVDIEVLRDPELSPTDKAVYAILCSFASVADRSGRPSIGTIADATNCSKNTARTAIKNLVSRGVLVREERYCEGRQTSCLYKIIGVNAYRGSKSEGGRVQILKGEGSKSDIQELEPKELELKDPSSKGAPAPDEQNSLSVDDESVSVNEGPLPENNAALKKIPSAMQETVEFMLMKTGRSGL